MTFFVPEPRPGPIALFRIVESNPVEEYDMLSWWARGRELRFVNAKALRLWDGISVYRTLDRPVHSLNVVRIWAASSLSFASHSMAASVSSRTMAATDTARFGAILSYCCR